MNRFFRLSPVLRARKAQEDVARGALNASHVEIRHAQALVKRRALHLAGADAPTEGTARAVVASLAARQSLAASLSGAHRMVADAEELTREKIAEMADAAKRRRAVEMMAERHAETIRVLDLKIEQADLDELTVTSKARNAARGIDAQTEQRGNSLRTGSGTAADREAVSRRTANAVAAERAVVDLADHGLRLAARRAEIRTIVRPVPALDAKQIDDEAELESDSTNDENRSRE